MFLAVAVEVEDLDVGKDSQELVAHEAEGGVVEVAVVGDEADDAGAGLLDVPLGEADEFDVVVVEPGFALAELLAIGADVAADFVVAADEAGDPGVGVGGEAGEGRVAEEDGEGFQISDFGFQIEDLGVRVSERASARRMLSGAGWWKV